MRKYVFFLLLVYLLTGCTKPQNELETAMELRNRLLKATACTFEAKITADYGDKIHKFSMACQADPEGNISFTVTEPSTITGIKGKLSGKGGELLFEDTALHYGLLAEEQLSPISAPWILVKTLRNGFIDSACTEDGKIRLSVDDSYESDPLRLDIWLDAENKPEHADILYDGRRILSIDVINFDIL